MRSNTDKPDDAAPDYLARVNRCIDFIVANLGEALRLDDVAAHAGFSPFHFHRIFRRLTGETLRQFVRRQRLERALYLMSHAPDRSLTDIALACGFSSSSDFTRSFKQRFGLPPSAFDIRSFRASRRAEFDHALGSRKEAARLERLPNDDDPDRFDVRLRDLPPRTVAYIRVTDPYRDARVPEACERLVRWAEERGLAGGQWLGYMWDDPDIVAVTDCRYDVAVVADEVLPEGEIGRFEFPAMTVAEIALDGDSRLEQQAFDWIYGTWLPCSDFQPDDQPCFEAWVGRPFVHGQGRLRLNVQLPVRRFG